MNDPVNIAIETRANMFAWGQVKPKDNNNLNNNKQYEEAVKSGGNLLQATLSLFKREGNENGQADEGKANEGKSLRDGMHEEAYPRGKRQYFPRE